MNPTHWLLLAGLVPACGIPPATAAALLLAVLHHLEM